ncbi:MAG: PAS domain-containing sensor histidine kinase [Thermodesulfobacteriota bacterium]
MQKPDHEKSREELIAELRTARAEIADYKAAAENTPYYRLAANHARDVIWVTDRTFAVRYVSPSVRQVLGYHPHEILDMDWARILTPAGLEIFQTAIQYRLAMEKAGRGDGAPRLFESDWIRKDGKRITAETTTRTLRDEDGRFAGIVGISRDVTQRKKMMDQLRANETRFRAILDTGPTITWIKDEAGRYIYLSRNFEKYFGIRGEDWLGKTCHDLYPPEIAAKFTENDLQVIEKDRPLEFLEEADCADGERRVCRVVKIPIRNAQGKRSTAGFGLDITDQKRAEEDLRKSERRLQEAQRTARIASYERNLDTGRGCWSDEHYRLFGYQPGEVSHSFELFLNHIHSDDRDRIAERLRAAYQNLTAYAHDCRYVRRGGEIRHARHTGRGETDPDGTRWLRGTFQDITEQKKFEEALRKSESHHRIIFEKSPLGMIRFSEDGAILDCNEQFIHLMDSSREKLIGFNTARQSTPKMRETIRRALAGNTAVYEDEYTSVTGGKTTHLRVVFNPIHPGRNPTGVIATLEDITERKQQDQALHEALEKAQDASRIKTRFLANMSHELRTPLNAVLGYCQILARDPALSESNREKVLTIRKSGEHLLTLINDILDIARIESEKLSLEPSPVRISGLLRNTVDILRPRADRKGISLVEKIDPTLPEWMLCDAKRLRQVLLNLLSNAVKFTDSGSVTLQAYPAGDRITFSVRDTGSGIPDKMLSSVFDPFYQVYSGGPKFEGTGLGLAISRNIIELMGGKIQVESTVGKGSEFRFAVELPAVSHEGKKKKPLWEETVLEYEKEQQKKFQTEDMDGDSKLLRLCSDEDLNRLRVLAGTGDIVGIRKYAERLRKEHPETGPCCDLLIRWAGNIDIAKINELLKD